MGRLPCCSKVGLNRGSWTAGEDKLLVDYINKNGEGRWRSLPKEAGLKRCGKSCRMRWLNYLRPDIKRGNITPDEEDLIIRLHRLLGNRWSLIAGRLPGRTDNEIKNYWNTILQKKAQPRRPPLEQVAPKTSNQLDNAGKVIRTKAVRCSKVVMIMPPPLQKDGFDTSPTTSGEEYRDNFPIESSGLFENGGPLDAGSDPDFWTMLSDWIMEGDAAN